MIKSITHILRNGAALLLLTVALGSDVFSQNTDEELAAQYYLNGEFDKAGDLYKKLFKSNESSVYYYDYYLECLIKTQSFNDAEKLIKRLVKKQSDNFYFLVDEVYLQDLQQKEGQENAYEAVLNQITPESQQVEQAANAFLKRGLNKYAIAAYELGNNANKASLPFTEKLLPLYSSEENYQALISLGLECLLNSPQLYEQVQKYFSRLIEFQKETAFLQEKILLFQQKHPEMILYTDLSIWMFVQQKLYKAAYRQAAAADKRESGRGERLFSLANECIEQKDFQTAAQCYQYIIDQGEEHINYMRARNGLLDCRYKNITEKPDYSSQELQELVTDYLAFLNQYGRNWNSSNAMRRLAEAYLFHTHETQKSIVILEELVDMKGVHPSFSADCKLLLGDAYLIEGNIWDAQLLYAQVDKDYKEDWLGQEAKFRMARLSYFNGDFEWARDQLEVLKTATSQLIANNALELSLLIQDNTGLDSTDDAMLEYAKAELLFFRNKNDACMQLLTELPFKFPGHSLEDEIAFLKGKLKERSKAYAEAVKYYESIVKNHSGDILADNALYRLAYLYEYVFQDYEKAVSYYEKIIFDYNSSLFVIESRKKYNALKERLQTEQKL